MTDITKLSPSEWDAFCAGHESGYAVGLEEGWRRADAHASATHRAAAEVVTAMIRVPEVDPAEAAARRARIDARFGEGGAA